MEKLSDRQIVSDAEFDLLLDNQVQTIKEFITITKPKGIFPMMTVMLKKTHDSEPEFVGVMFEELPEEHHLKFQRMRDIGAQVWREQSESGNHPVAVVLTTEAWAKIFDVTKGEAPELNKMLSEYPDKTEVLLVSGFTITKRSNVAMYDMHRDADQSITGIKLRFRSGAEDSEDHESNLLLQFFVGCKQENQRMKDHKI